ncbi:STAS/SEC14 domain-containing protein [Sulfitobacter sp. S190]|uniref:STAS/SEC14 domain-containing protein n=1 Tax=Sulfitobacter sp. S190 TaxID=2867022 RepID=UPI0021A6581D|nr:STAS/SEC14 domain-containing protein [Sulfitobacter sp. S190]UWR21268.1 STAS/SEC14 domain-containing protein [Sulfitobacter sp. S190]
MTAFQHGSIHSIPTTTADVHAFKIEGHVDDDDMEAMSKYMNDVFDQAPGKVSMLLDLSSMTGRDLDIMFDDDVLKAQVRSWSKVARYAVIGAPESAATMIKWADKVIPVEARAFDSAEASSAWEFVGASPQAV